MSSLALCHVLLQLVQIGLERRIHGGEESLAIDALLARLQRGEEGRDGD